MKDLKKYGDSPVVITRVEYDEYVAAKFLLQHVIDKVEFNKGEIKNFICVDGKLVEYLFPAEVSMMRREKCKEED